MPHGRVVALSSCPATGYVLGELRFSRDCIQPWIPGIGQREMRPS